MMRLGLRENAKAAHFMIHLPASFVLVLELCLPILTCTIAPDIIAAPCTAWHLNATRLCQTEAAVGLAN